MSVDTILGVALDLAYLAVFAFTLIDYIRHPEPVRRDVMLLFAALAVVLLVPVLQMLIPGVRPAVGLVVLPALLAQPLLVLRLVRFVRPMRRRITLIASAAFVLLTGAFVVLIGSGAAPGSPIVVALAVALLGYFAVGDGAATVLFWRAARNRAGASRSRLSTAAIATGLLGVAVLILLGSGLVTTPGSAASSLATNVVRVVALLSGVSYLVAFAPPRALRRLSQQAIVYGFVRDLSTLPSTGSIDAIWRLLERTAQTASGASRAAVVLDRASPDPDPSLRRHVVGFESQRWPSGHLELDLPRHALFQDDDVELVALLVDRGARAAERESYLVERERLIGELQAASAAKSDFLAAMSHELRTPLNAIIGFSELLTDERETRIDPATVTSYADHIHGSGLHLLELVNDVLDLARVEAGRLDLKPVPFELDALVRQTVESVQPLADQKGQVLKLTLASVSIDADPSRIRQILLNLVSNAIKFTDPGGEIQVCVTLDGDDVQLAVSDTGRGIPKADYERIFEAFQQGDGPLTATHHEGTGLGLALSRQLVEAHGGRIDLTSEVGKGSEFTVHLPLHRLESDADMPPALAPGKPRVLVIEDDPAAAELLRVHLDGAGYAVLIATAGRQGVSWAAQTRPDAILLDILLPDIDGWEVLQRLKSDARTRAIPVMVVSVVDDRQLGMALGAVDYVVKPIAREPLLEALGRLTFTTKVRTRTVRVLVIDGDTEAEGRYKELLEPDGFQVSYAGDGGTGRRLAADDHPDLILLDATLPDVDGFELAATLRHDESTSGIPVWLTTQGGLLPEAKSRLNGNVQGVLARGDDALVALRGWLARRGAPA
jgi:signal transduction histidine kinase/DNA-binding response OmpR family regulator